MLPLNKFGKSTGFFLKEAIDEKRFESAGFMLAAKGAQDYAEKLGDFALEQRKFEQAIQIYSHLGSYAKLALANYLAAKDCLKKGGSTKLAACKFYASIEAYNKLLKQDKANTIFILQEIIRVCENLTELFEEEED
ncbi:MAG: hypothetical protein FJ088_15800, partial [Deltaproteobacteria bacterium]|nr:hypothetical protein [Deltaproteobacteria bacterium]